MKIMRIVLVAAAFLVITNQTYAVEFGENSWQIDNPYMNIKTLPLGSALIYTGYGTKSLIYSSTNILGTDIVDGVKCLRVHSIRTEKAQFSEIWMAQDMSSNVYALKFWDGEDPGPVVLGKNGAGLFMPSNPKVGDTVEGDKTVIEVGVTIPMLSTGLGPFTNCLKTVEPDGDIEYLAPGLGEVKKEYIRESGGYELKEVILGSSSSNDGSSTIDNALKITIPSLKYMGADLGVTVILENYPNINDPSGLYWKLKEITTNN
jgi:hypothetical protein